MIEDMTLRKLGPSTQTGYLRAVVKFTRYLGGSPDTAEAEDLRRFQLQMVEDDVSSITINATLTGLKFFFEQTLDKPELLKKVKRVYEPRKIPEVLSVKEVTRLLDTAGSLKYQAALSVAYGSGLRASEIVHLKISDIADGAFLSTKHHRGGQFYVAVSKPEWVRFMLLLTNHRDCPNKLPVVAQQLGKA